VEKLAIDLYMKYMEMNPPPIWIKDSATQPAVLLSATLETGLHCITYDQNICFDHMLYNDDSTILLNHHMKMERICQQLHGLTYQLM
jgi:hypothetical protein